MGNKCQVQDAQAKFSEFLEASLAEVPQIVTKRGVEKAVLPIYRAVAEVGEDDKT